MHTDELDLSGEPSSIVARIAAAEARLRERGDHDGGPTETVRETTYKGHSVVVRTTHAISVDGIPLEGRLGVFADGQVHYDAIPNLGFASAVALAEQLIDMFGEDFGDAGEDAQDPPDDSEDDG